MERTPIDTEPHTSRERLTPAQSLTIGVTLFSMFFGAGNLILPPLLGLQAGTDAVPAMVGFLLSGIGLPVLGVVVVALAGNLHALAGRVHPRFASVFAALVYLAIGPLLAIPRTSSTAFEMLAPLLPADWPVAAARCAFSVAFFAVAFAMALRPGRLSRLLGAVTGPALIALIVVVTASSVLAPTGEVTAPVAPYAGAAASQGFITGYQTMDLLASLTFGLVIAQNIHTMGVREPGAVAREISRAGIVAGALMALIYCGFSFVGATMGSALPGVGNGAAILTASATAHFGLAGTVIIAAIFLLACLNVCVGLVSCCGEYFAETYGASAPDPTAHRLGRVPYRAWALAFALFSCAVSNVGLDMILQLSVPLLSALYPPAIVLVGMGLAARHFDARPASWPLAVAAALVVSVPVALRDAAAPGLWLPFDLLPLAGFGMAWVVPMLIALAVGVLVGRRGRYRSAISPRR